MDEEQLLGHNLGCHLASKQKTIAPKEAEIDTVEDVGSHNIDDVLETLEEIVALCRLADGGNEEIAEGIEGVFRHRGDGRQRCQHEEQHRDTRGCWAIA